jgi:hypothetical protein
MNGRTGSRAVALRGLRYAPAPQSDGEIERALNPDCERGRAFPRQILPEPCCGSSPNGGQRAQGRPGAGGTRWSVRYRNAHGVDRWGGRSPGLPCADGFNGVLRALPGERCTIAPVTPPIADARARSGRYITARLDAQTPGVRTTRLLRPRTVPPKSSGACVCSPLDDRQARSPAPCRTRRVRTHGCPPCHHAARAVAAASTATRPACRDDRERPFGRARISAVCHKSEIRKSEIFLRRGLDGVFCPTRQPGRE